MAVTATTETLVSELEVGSLLHIKERIFAGVKLIEEGHGVRTLHVFGYHTRTLGVHQHVETLKF